MENTSKELGQNLESRIKNLERGQETAPALSRVPCERQHVAQREQFEDPTEQGDARSGGVAGGSAPFDQIKQDREAYMQELMAREAEWAKNAIKDEVYDVPHGEKKVLLHSCCAPCSGPLIEKMHESGLELTIFFYNPNIHPLKEYEIRKNENIRYAEKLGIPFVDADYDVQDWFARAKGMEREPERGARCTMCFDMRFERTALYAAENNFRVFTSSLGISRWKNMDQINDCGIRAAGHYPDVTYWTYNWRKDGGGARMYDLAKEEAFYAQQYCGCIYSLRDTNEWRESKGREKIAIGETWYEKKLEV